MEKDKTLLTLATGGIGLLSTLARTIGPASALELWIYVAAGWRSPATIVMVIKIFEGTALTSKMSFGAERRTRINLWCFWIAAYSGHSSSAVLLTGADWRVRRPQPTFERRHT